jgi:glycosyltransferase involved in cell wall biosynthesis
MVSQELRIVAPFHAGSGYSRHARALLLCALAAGYRVEAVESDMDRELAAIETGGELHYEAREIAPSGRAIPDHQRAVVAEALSTRVHAAAPTILLQLPLSLAHWPQFHEGPCLGYTMVECNGIRESVASAMRCVDGLLAPSQYVAEVFGRCLPGMPVAVMPDPVDPHSLSPEGPRWGGCPGPAFLFGTVTTGHARKHWRELMQAFAEEFTGEDVRLVVKTSGAHGEMDALARGCQAYGADVRVVRETWDEATLASFYRRMDCYVGVGHEGFGLCFVEAGLCGTPSVALDIGGQTDVVTEETGYLVNAEMQPCIGQHPAYFASEFQWAGCTVPELRRTLRRAYEGRDPGPGAHIHFAGELKEKDPLALARSLGYTPDALASRLRNIVEWSWRLNE